MNLVTRRSALLLPLATAGCSFIDGLLGDAKTPLPGKRETIAATTRPGLAIDPANTARITIPPPVPMATWPQPGGSPSHVVGNVAARGFTPAWRTSIGEGGGYREKITAQPIVIPGRVVTMDSDAMVACFDLATGSRIWRTSTEADNSRSTNVGGGVSYADGTIYAATGRGELLALDAGTGTIRWRKPLDSPARSAPTIADKRLIVLTLDDRVQSFDTNGQRQWSYQATTVATTLFGQASPAFADGIVVAAFGSGELVALRAESGTLVWSDSLAASRGRNSIVDLSGIRAFPVIDEGRVVAIGGGGLMVTLDLRSGRRLWERDVGGLQTPWLAGGWIFVQTLDQVLAAVGRDDGRVRWATDLPHYDNPEKKRDPLFWTGPVMMNSRLILSGSNGTAVSVDPVTGNLIGRVDISDAAAVAPVAAAGTLLVVTDDGTLQAFR